MDKKARSRKIVVSVPTVQKETVAPVVVQKPKWKVLSGGITLLNRKSYEKGETFEAEEWEIPEAFRDIIKPMTPLENLPKKVKPVYQLREVFSTVEEQDEEGFVPVYDIINEADKVISEKPLPKVEADALLKELNK